MRPRENNARSYAPGQCETQTLPQHVVTQSPPEPQSLDDVHGVLSLHEPPRLLQQTMGPSALTPQAQLSFVGQVGNEPQGPEAGHTV